MKPTGTAVSAMPNYQPTGQIDAGN